MQQYFLAAGIENQERMIYIATNLLRGDAATWWRHLYMKLAEEEEALPSWRQFERIIIKKVQTCQRRQGRPRPPRPIETNRGSQNIQCDVHQYYPRNSWHQRRRIGRPIRQRT